MKKGSGFFFLLLLILGMWGASCENDDCISYSTNILSVQFLDSAGNPKNKTVSFIFSPEAPEILFYGDTTASNYYLPVNTSQPETTYFFGNNDNSVDTLIVGYTRRQRIISADCGFELRFGDVTVISTTFPEAKSLENDLSLLNEINIEIYH